MASTSLPTYAKILITGFSQQRESALLRTEMESGAPRQSKVRSRVMVTRSCIIYIATLADFRRFETWYSVNLNEGASWFNYYDPVSGTTKECRFVGGGYTATPTGGALTGWQVSAKIESWG